MYILILLTAANVYRYLPPKGHVYSPLTVTGCLRKQSSHQLLILSLSFISTNLIGISNWTQKFWRCRRKKQGRKSESLQQPERFDRFSVAVGQVGTSDREDDVDKAAGLRSCKRLAKVTCHSGERGKMSANLCEILLRLSAWISDQTQLTHFGDIWEKLRKLVLEKKFRE